MVFSGLHAQRILLTGASGFLGQFLQQELATRLPRELRAPTQEECDLMNPSHCQVAVKDIDVVIHTAGTVGGIEANRTRPGEFFYSNTLMGMQLMEAARLAGVKKFVQIGTVCSYPKHPLHVPTPETELWQGYPEETNAPYGLAKKALLTMGQSYRQQYGFNVIHLLLVNMYGPYDHFGSSNAHVIPALISRFWHAHQTGAKEIVAWGSGNPTREFLYVEDAVRGIVLAAEQYNENEPINLGSGQEISIKRLAELIAEEIGFTGQIIWDTTRPDGQPRRLFDTSRAKKSFGFQARVDFVEGLKRTVSWYKENITQPLPANI